MSTVTVSGHFLPGSAGPLATVVWAPPKDVRERFGVLYLPPFGDEMNKSRRMAALQARTFAAAGGLVALLDPRGTGDSGGDHGSATWEGWRDDVAVAWTWLAGRTHQPCILWGLRLGALLAADVVASGCVAPVSLLLWQPVASGRIFFNQLLRLATAQQIVGNSTGGPDAKALRGAMSAGTSIEIAGYELNPALVSGAEALDLAELGRVGCPVIWREASIDAASPISPATARIAARWRQDGAEVDLEGVNGPSFWASQEIAEAPKLVASTTAAVTSLFGNHAQRAP
ncbi:MAG: hydrolase 2, exosortase A system-associated [Casimicrobiaceae bacterium]